MAEKVVYELSLNDLLSGKVKEADAIARQLDGTMSTLQGTIGKVGAAIGIAFGLSAIKDFGMSMIAAGTTVENAQTGLTTLLKDSNEASGVIKNTMEDATKTPFAFEGLLAANKALISAGVSSKKAREDVLNLSNAIAATGGGDAELQRMVVNLQQIKNAGKATALDIKQFAYAGVNIYKVLAEATGQPISKVKDMEVSYNNLTMALKKAHAEGGIYYHGLENMAGNTSVQISNLGDAMFQLKNKMFTDLKPAITATIQTLFGFIDKLKQGWEWSVKNKDSIVVLTKTVGTLWLAFKGASILSAVSASLSALIPVLTGAGAATTAFGETLTLALGPVGLLVAALGTLAFAYFDTMNAQQAMAEKNASFLGKVAKDETTMLDERVAALEKGGRSHNEALKTALNNDLEAINSAVVPMIDKWKEYQDYLNNSGKGWFNPLEGMDVDKFRKDIDILEARQTSALNYKGKVAVGKGKGATEAEPTKDLAPKGATGQKITTINISIAKMIETFKISTANIQESSSKVRELVAQTLLSAVNDSQITAGI